MQRARMLVNHRIWPWLLMHNHFSDQCPLFHVVFVMSMIPMNISPRLRFGIQSSSTYFQKSEKWSNFYPRMRRPLNDINWEKVKGLFHIQSTKQFTRTSCLTLEPLPSATLSSMRWYTTSSDLAGTFALDNTRIRSRKSPSSFRLSNSTCRFCLAQLALATQPRSPGMR